MTEHESADEAPAAEAAPTDAPAAAEAVAAPRRRGTYLPAAEPVTPKSIDEAADLIMPIYAEPVVRKGATRAAGALPASTELTFEADPDRTAATRLRRGGQIATAGLAAAVIAVVASAFAPTPDSGASTAYDSPAIADTAMGAYPSAVGQPMAAEGGRVSVDLHRGDEESAAGDQPSIFGIPLPDVLPFIESAVEAVGGADGADAFAGPRQPGSAGGGSGDSGDASQPAAPGGSAAPGSSSPSPSTPSASTPSASSPSVSSPSASTPSGPTGAPSVPVPTAPAPSATAPAPEPSATTPPAPVKAPLAVSASCRDDLDLLGLGVLTSNTCTVTATGEPGATVQLTYGRTAWRQVTLDGSGRATQTVRSVDVVGLFGLLNELLNGSEFDGYYL
ncbi:hypothetical protein [Microbacterium sp. NPDC096154]|uniref:hypothetical protein n=1 Tax=Microbacterium sp. NPDC096154 TaxID=3155549 RepID=UPI003327EC23